MRYLRALYLWFRGYEVTRGRIKLLRGDTNFNLAYFHRITDDKELFHMAFAASEIPKLKSLPSYPSVILAREKRTPWESDNTEML